MATPPSFQFTPFDESLALEASGDAKHEWINGLIYAMSRDRASLAPDRGLPDLLVGHAALQREGAVEVLSSSTEQRDRNELFQQIDSLEEYVLIAQDDPCIEVRRRDGRNWITDTRRTGETIVIHGLAIPVDAIYR